MIENLASTINSDANSWDKDWGNLKSGNGKMLDSVETNLLKLMKHTASNENTTEEEFWSEHQICAEYSSSLKESISMEKATMAKHWLF